MAPIDWCGQQLFDALIRFDDANKCYSVRHVSFHFGIAVWLDVVLVSFDDANKCQCECFFHFILE
jgi:hypothetical protein